MSRKNRTLPFVVQPRLSPIIESIGSEFSGTIEIERRGYLCVAEKAWIQAFDSGDESQGILFRLAANIGNDLSMDPNEVFKMITSSGAQDPRLTPYAADLLSAIQAVNAAQERKKFVMATCLITNRIDPKWQVEDTMTLHPDILDGLAQLFVEEETKSLEAFQESEKEESEENEGQKSELGKD